MTPDGSLSDDDLHAFIDGQTDPVRTAEIADRLSQDPILAARVAAYRADRDALRRAVAGIARQPIPDAWRSRIEQATATRAYPLPSRRQAIAAGIVISVLGASAVALLRPRQTTILADAEAARAGNRPSARTLAAADDGLLRASLQLHVSAPDLRRFGFVLTRLDIYDPRGAHRAAQLDYRDTMQRQLTVYVQPSPGDVRFDLLHRGDLRLCIWQDDVIGAVIIAPVSAGAMMRIASAAYASLNL